MLPVEFLWVCPNCCLLNKSSVLEPLSSPTAGWRVSGASVPMETSQGCRCHHQSVCHILMLCLIWFPGWDKFYEQVFWLIRWLILFKLESHFPSDSYCFAQIQDKSYSLERPAMVFIHLPGWQGGPDDQESDLTPDWVTSCVGKQELPRSSDVLSCWGRVDLGPHFRFLLGILICMTFQSPAQSKVTKPQPMTSQIPKFFISDWLSANSNVPKTSLLSIFPKSFYYTIDYFDPTFLLCFLQSPDLSPSHWPHKIHPRLKIQTSFLSLSIHLSVISHQNFCSVHLSDLCQLAFIYHICLVSYFMKFCLLASIFGGCICVFEEYEILKKYLFNCYIRLAAT